MSANLSTQGEAPPHVTAEATVAAIIDSAGRRGRTAPLRRAFLQVTHDAGQKRPGPAAEFVRTSDKTGLNLYLLALTKASAEPWDVALPSVVWARALGMELPDTPSARSTISKAWLRLERRHLITRARTRRMAHITLLREDGSGEPYTRSKGGGDPYLQLPTAYWTEPPTGGKRPWYLELGVPAIAVLLIALSHGDDFRLPLEDGARWYGISPDSVSRGLAQLRDLSALETRRTYKTAPLSPVGYTEELLHTLKAPFGPQGKASQRRIR